MDNKRKQERVPASIKSEVHDEKIMTFSTTQNISHGGIFISTPEPLEIGSQIDLSLYLPGENPVSLKGVVRWTNEKEDDSVSSKCGMGIEFVDADDAALGILKKTVIK
jgi:uncharacterized protein (TIGR02266 family)